MDERKTALSVEHLAVSFTQYERGFWQVSFVTIRNLSVTVHEEEMVAIVGFNGSGKSLLAHAVMGIPSHNASWGGEIAYCGESPTQKRLKALRGHRIVLVPQSMSYLDPLMRAGAQVCGGRRGETSRKRCREVLGRYEPGEETKNLYPFELSGGMIRRILIPTAVMEKPKLVIANELTPGLHIKVAKWVMSHFREIVDEEAGVPLTTHDLELTLETADRIVVFYAGINVEEVGKGDFEDLDCLRHPYTKALYQAMPQHGFKLVAGTQPFSKNISEGYPYGPRRGLCEAECLEDVEYRSLRGGMVRCRRAT